ncbi:MAG: hypothetical protein WCF36_07065 [Candidatus Nanopelagicales bacterium]
MAAVPLRRPSDRVAWIVEQRAGELTDEERLLVREASQRMLAAMTPEG